MMSSPKPTRTTITDDLLANATTALSVANNFGSLLPIPMVSSLIQTTQVIVTAAQAVQNNKRSCAELASRSAQLAKLIKEEVHGREDLLNDRIQAALQELNIVFKEVETFILKQSKVGLLGRFGKRGSITLEVTGLTAKLDFMMQMFQTTSSLSTGLIIKKMEKVIAGLEINIHNERKYDGGNQFRIIRQCDIDLLDHCHAIQQVSGRRNASIEYYKGRFEGKAVTVLVKRTKDKMTVMSSKQTDSETDELSDRLSGFKQLWHPNVAQLEGYSDTRSSGPQFLVLKGDLVMWEAYVAMLPADEYNLQYVRTIMETYAAIQYLWHRHLWFDAQYVQRRIVMVDITTGRTVEGVDGVLQLSPRTNDRLSRINTAHDYMVMLYQRYQSSSSKLTLEAVLSEWADLYPNQLVWEEVEFTYTGCDESLYLYAGVVMYYDCFRNEPSAFTFLEFLNHTIQPVLPDWPPTLRYAQYEGIHSETTPLPASESFVLRIESPAPETTHVCSPVYEANCDWDSNWMSQYLCRRGYDLFINHNLDSLRHVCIVYQTSFTFEAILHDQDPSEGHQPVYLHISPMQDGRVPVPWAYFSFTREPIPDGEDTLMKPAVEVQGVCDRFISNLPGVDAEVL